MLKKILTVALLSFTLNASALTFQEAKDIYLKIILSNHFNRPPPIYLENNSEANAVYNGKYIEIYSGILTYCRNKDELALIIGHELGHFTAKGRLQTDWESEYAADHDGAIYARQAGYNVCKGAQAIYRFHDKAYSDHPASKDRFHRLGCH